MPVRIRVALVAILATVLAANAGATIYAAATAPTIKACVKSSGPQKGLMRYLASGACASGEKLLAWNVTGPTGPTGPAGPSGGSGGGQAGPTPYWVSEWRPAPLFGGEPASTSLAVPSGTYLVALQLELASDTSSVPVTGDKAEPALSTVKCTLTAGATTRTFVRQIPEGWTSFVAYQGVAKVAAGGTVRASCTQTTVGSPQARAVFIRVAIDGLLYATPITVQ